MIAIKLTTNSHWLNSGEMQTNTYWGGYQQNIDPGVEESILHLISKSEWLVCQ
jgi:hypothetical protein